ncbi:MAG: hypothetical protein UDQ92_08485 [Lachnospiraceae bacterium]|nr:hypothetical protein [Lachnospiraceae bacterium]
MKKYIFTTVLCIATIWMSACASGKKIYESEKMNAYERTEYFPTREYADTRIEALDSTDEKALYCESRFEDIDGITTYVVKNTYEYDYETGKAEKIESFTAENYSSFYVPGGKMLELDIDKNLYVLDEQRQVITKVNLTELTFPNQASEKSSINYIFDIKSDGNYVYVNGKNTANQGIVLVLDMDLQGKAIFLADGGWTLVPMRENKVKLVDNKDGSVYGYKEERNKLDKEGKLPKNVMDFSVTRGFCPGNTEYDYFYYTKGYKNEDNGIGKDYLIGVKDGRQEKIFDFTAMGIADFYIMNITPDTQEGFYIWVIASEEEPVLYHFTPSETVGDYSGKAGKICCKIGSLWTVNNLYIEEFNKQSEDYYFEMVVYGDMYEDRDIAITHLFLDCQDGKLDGILLDDIEDELIKNDALYDLENYFAQSKVVSKDRFITHYLESVTDEKGRIYALYPDFKAFGYAYDEKIDFSNLMQYENLCGKTKSFLSTQGAGGDLAWLLEYSGNRIVDEENKKIHVKEDAFRSMLQFLKIQSTDQHKNFDPVMQYCEGESCATRANLSEPSDYLYFNELFHKNAVFSNVGADGLIIGSREGLLGVCSKSENKEALFALYDFLYEPENYHNFFFWGMIMPVVREEYGLWKDYFLATEAYEDKYGKYNRKHDFQIGMGAAEVIIPVGSISEKEAEAAVTALQEVKYVKPMKAAYENIILEEAEAYFTGNQDLDRACDNMENRLRLALEENKD